MQLYDLKAVLPGGSFPPTNVRFSGVACDSRRVRPGDLFVALRGTQCDGNAYLQAAAEAGAAAAITDCAPAEAPLPLVTVDDARLALARISAWQHPRATRLALTGITGTNGKTTTALLLQHILRSARHRTGLIGTIHRDLGHITLSSDMTTPQSPDLCADLAHMAGAGCTHAVMEVSSHALDQHRVAALPFRVAVFTNLTQDHLDYHKTMDGYAAAKARLFAQLGPDATAVVNSDDPAAERMLRDCPADVLRYGLNDTADVRATDLRLSTAGTGFHLDTPQGEAEVEMPLLGRFNVSNALAAVAAGLAQGVALPQIVQALAEFAGVPGRMESIPNDRGFRVLVDYAHTHDALENVLRTLRELQPRRVVTVFGCGGDRDPGKRPKMGAVASRYSDVVVLTNDNPRGEDPGKIVLDIIPGLDGLAAWTVELDRAEAIRLAVAQAEPGDVVLLAGKGHEDYQLVGNRRLAFDDRAMAREALVRRAAA